MIYALPAPKKRISWEPSLGTPRSDRMPRVRRQSTPRLVGTQEAPIHATAHSSGAASKSSFPGVSSGPPSDTFDLEQLLNNMLLSHGAQPMASPSVAAGRAAPVRGSPARSLFGGSFSSPNPSTFNMDDRRATPFPTFASNPNFDFSSGGQHAPAPPEFKRSPALFRGDPITAFESRSSNAAAPSGFTFAAPSGGFGGDSARQVPAPTSFRSSLNGSFSTLSQDAPFSTATPSDFTVNASSGESGPQCARQASPSSSFESDFIGFQSPPKKRAPPNTPKSHSFNAASPFGFTFSVANDESGGQRKRQASSLSSFGSSLKSPSCALLQSTPDAFKPRTPTFTFDASDRSGEGEAQRVRRNPFRSSFGDVRALETMGGFEAPVSTTGFRASLQSPSHSATGLGTFGTGGPQVLASTSRPVHASANLGANANSRTCGSLFDSRLLRSSAQAKVAPTAASTSLPPHHPQPPSASMAPRPADDSSAALGHALVGNPSKKISRPAGGRRTRNGTKADGQFVHASLKEIRNMVGFITPEDIQSCKNKYLLEGALKALQDGSFDCNKRHFKPEPNHFGRQPIRVSGKKAVLQQRLLWFLFHMEVDLTEE